MNNATILVTLADAPQMGYTSDNQTPVTEFMGKVPALKDGDPDTSIKCVVWGQKAEDASQLKAGQIAILTGSLRMDVKERQGAKEKVVTMTVSSFSLLDSMPVAMERKQRSVEAATTGSYNNYEDF